MSTSFLCLPLEVRFCVYEFYEDWESPDPRELILHKSYNTIDKRYSPSLGNVHHGWRNLLSTCKITRAEILSIIWRAHPVILQPLVDRCVSFGLEWPVRQLVIEVRKKHGVLDPGDLLLGIEAMYRRNAAEHSVESCAMSMEDLKLIVKFAASHHTLDHIDVVMDLLALDNMAKASKFAQCSAHATRFWKSAVRTRLGKDANRHMYDGGFLHFRIHFSMRAAVRTRSGIAKHFPDIASARNYQVGDCKDHEMASCKELTCRILHALEEVYGDKVDCDMLDPYLTFYGYDSEDSRSYVYEASDYMMPIVLDAPCMDGHDGGMMASHNAASAWISLNYD